MNISFRFVFASCIFYYLSACTFQTEEEYFGEPICDSTEINRDTLKVYYEDLTYIFSGICSQCHNTQFTYRTGINMDSYNNVVASFNTGKPLPAIKHEGLYKMPYNMPKLSDCEIQRIAKWYEEGMPKITQ